MSIRLLARATWSLGAAAWLLLATSALAAPQPGASAAKLFPFPDVPDVLLWPPFPCIESDLFLYVRAFEATPCDSFLNAFRSGDREITIRTVTHTDRRCAVAPSVFYALRIPFGSLATGQQTIHVSRRMLMMEGDLVVDSLVTGSELNFTVADACPDPPMPIAAEDLPYVDHVVTVPSPACPDRPVTVRFDGHFDDGCGRLVSAGLDGGIRLVLAPYPERPQGCPAVLAPWHAEVSIGQVIRGSHSVLVQQTIQGNDGVWPPIPDTEYVALFDFTVSDSCRSGPNALPYVSSITIGPDNPYVGICPGQPYTVKIAGKFPNGCWDIRKVQLLPASPTPVIRLLLDDRACITQLCDPTPVTWDTSVVLPGLPTGSYFQGVQVGLVSCSDSIPPDSLFRARVPFSVDPPDSCVGGPSFGCLLASWAPGLGGCNAVLSQGTASLGFRVATPWALSGLQGEFRFLQMGLGVAAIETDGPAVGMRLAWSKTPGGARFVLFAEHGAPIPGSGEPVQILKVKLEALPIRADIAWPTNGFDLLAENILGSDVNGQEVVECPTLRPAATVAHICFERRCDFDGNGVADVRDLVRMVHCVNGDGPCPADPATSYDCNGDALFDLDDVLCCAIHLLQGPECPECVIDPIREEPSVSVRFEDPVVTPTGVDIPVRLSNTDRLGAARLALKFPADRFTLAGAEAHEAAWLELHQAGEGRAAVGLIRIAPDISLAVPQMVRVLLHLRLKPGATLGGAITLDSGEFSGPDGVMVRVDASATPRSLDGKAALTISSIRPNPSPGTFTIDLALSAPARVEVSVHDLAGRRVAQLFQGDLPAGAKRFVWEGSDKGGGVYFLRASVGGKAQVRKLIILPRRPVMSW